MLFHKEETAVGSIRSHKLDNSHGPDVNFGAIFLPGKQFGRGVGRAAALRAERVRVAEDARTVAQTEVCEERRGRPAPNQKTVETKKE